MKIESSIADAYQWTMDQRLAGRSVGLVPTMGALHQGHISLVVQSRKQCDLTVATIFVNPTQFAPHEDLSRYPRTLGDDLEKLETAGTDLVFTPEPGDIYPINFSTYINPPKVAQILEGQCRPDHFRGVTTIVLKLFNIIPATHAFFGQKDYQQAAVISAMCHDLNLPIQLHTCPIIREPDGLAMSSRNRYLSAEQRQKALGLSRALVLAERQVAGGQTMVKPLQEAMRKELLAAAVDAVEYVEIVDATNMNPLTELDRRAVALIAARVGQTRLIDNTLLQITPRP